MLHLTPELALAHFHLCQLAPCISIDFTQSLHGVYGVEKVVQYVFVRSTDYYFSVLCSWFFLARFTRFCPCFTTVSTIERALEWQWK